MKCAQVQFKASTLMPDGESTNFVNVEKRPGYHDLRCDPYDLEIVEVMPGLYMLRVTSTRSGEADHIPLGDVKKIRFFKEPQAKIGEGKPGPGRGHTGKMKPEVAV